MNKVELLKLKTEAVDWLKLVFSLQGLWVFIPGFLGMSYVYIAHANGWLETVGRGPQEMTALWLMGTATAIMLVRVSVFNYYLDFVLLALAVSFLCREIHFPGTHKGVYVAIAIVGIWAYFRRKQILAEFATSKILKIGFFGMAWTYMLAILIQRRAFRHMLPNEQLLHTPLEEVVENVCHIFFILVTLLCFTLGRSAPAGKDDDV